MLEYFTYKKVKKHREEKKASTPSSPTVRSPLPQQEELLTAEDEQFLQRVISAEGTPPPLPDRPLEGVQVTGDSTNNASQLVKHDGNDTVGIEKQDKGKGKENGPAEKKAGRFSFLHRSGTKKDKKGDGLHPDSAVSPKEGEKEEDDINRILEDLNLSAVNNRAFSLSKESQVLVQQFTVILKDIVNGAPTAYDDLTHLFDTSQGQLNKNYEQLPSFLKKLITQLPDKLSKNLAPELLAVAAEAQRLGGGAAAAGTEQSFGAAAKSFLKPNSLKDLVTKPGAVVSMLKYIMNVLKLRWPAFMGTNVLLSLGLFVLIFVLWYFHKRGREVRLDREGRAQVVDSEGRIVELPDDPMLEGASTDRPGPSRSSTHGPDSRRERSDADPYDDARTSSRPGRDSKESKRSRESRKKSVEKARK